MINVEVIYATPEHQEPISVLLPIGSTIPDAIQVSRILEIYPEIAEKSLVCGIYGEIIHDPANYALDEGERVEIYRPLLIDPKEARRQRVLDK